MTARRGVFWPLLLIALGVLFLMGNFGLISGVSWRAILSLWPLLLVLIGLDIAFARRWPLPTLAAEILVIVAGLALAATSSTVGFFGFPTGGGNGVADVSAPRGGATAMSVTVNGGAGHYRVSGGATDLVDAHSANPDLRLRTSGPAARPDLRVDQVGPEGLFRNTGQVFETPAIDWAFIAGDADRRPRRSRHGMRAESDCLNNVYHRIDFRCRGAGFHYD